MNEIKNSEKVKSSVSNTGIMRINLNNPSNLNALSEKIIVNMHEYLKQAAKDNKVRVIIISAEGSTFSSGHDLKELKKAKESVDKGKIFTKKL